MNMSKPHILGMAENSAEQGQATTSLLYVGSNKISLIHDLRF